MGMSRETKPTLNVGVTEDAKFLAFVRQQFGLPGGMNLVADDAGPRGHRAVHVGLALIELLLVTAKTETRRGIVEKHVSMLAAVRVVTTGA